MLLINISGNISMEKAKHKLEGRIKNNPGVQGHSFKAEQYIFTSPLKGPYC